MWAEIPAISPPIVWENIAWAVSSFAPMASIIATWVDKYPDQHIQIDVKTAKSFAVKRLFVARFLTSPIAAPADPRAVIGTAIDSLLVKPNRGLRIKDNFSPIHGKIGTPSLEAPV